MKTPIIPSTFKSFQYISALALLLFLNFKGSAQELNITNQEIKITISSATETFDYAFKAYSTEIFSESQSYMQQALPTAKETKAAAMNAERSLTELLQATANNSENTQLINNIKRQKEIMSEAVAKATRAYEYAEKACASTTLEELLLNAKQVVNASDKVIKQAANIQNYSEINTSTK